MNEDTSPLEQEFRTLMETVGEQIKGKVSEANRLLGEAVALAVEYGIPFNSNISQLGQNYVPASFRSKFPDVDAEVVEELTGVSTYRLDASADGWEESQLCY